MRSASGGCSNGWPKCARLRRVFGERRLFARGLGRGRRWPGVPPASGREPRPRLMGLGSRAQVRKGLAKCGVAPGAGIGDCDFQDVQAMPEE